MRKFGLKLTEVLQEYRIVDLSEKVVQETSADPTGERRWYFIRMFPYPTHQVGGEWMHMIVMESHIGTHVEAPAHWIDSKENWEGAGKDITGVPLESYYGEAVLIKCDKFSDGYAIKPQDLKDQGVKENDIVIFGLSDREAHKGKAPYLSDEVVSYMADLPIKMVGFDRTVGAEDMPKYLAETDTRKRFLGMTMHKTFCNREIPIIECIDNLSQLTKKRFFLFAWPARMGGLEAFVTRVVAFEPTAE